MAVIPIDAAGMTFSANGATSSDTVSRRRLGVAFVLPRADWINSNLPLMNALALDADIAVTLVAPVGYRAGDGLKPVRVVEFPFYADATDTGSFIGRCREMFRAGRRRRALIDRFFDDVNPACLLVISDTSRELLPFVMLARRRHVQVVFMQSIFLATPLRQHVRSENWEMAKRRGVKGLLRLFALHLIQRAAGLPGTMFKSSAMGGRSDAVFVINDDQKKLFAETVDPRLIRVTGTPFVDVLHRAVEDARRLADRAAFCRRLDCDNSCPIVAYFSRSLEQFSHLDPAIERDAQEFYVETLLDRLPAATVVVKLHPVEDDRAFKRFVGHPRVRIVKDLDVHVLIHHCALVVGVGPSTPTLLAVFHRRPRLIVVRVDDASGEVRAGLEVQPEFLEVCVCVRTRNEYERELADLASGGWPDHVSAKYHRKNTAGLERFSAGFDGGATARAHQGLRHLLGLA
jgi:hypothetical protein